MSFSVDGLMPLEATYVHTRDESKGGDKKHGNASKEATGC